MKKKYDLKDYKGIENLDFSKPFDLKISGEKKLDSFDMGNQSDGEIYSNYLVYNLKLEFKQDGKMFKSSVRFNELLDDTYNSRDIPSFEGELGDFNVESFEDLKKLFVFVDSFNNNHLLLDVCFFKLLLLEKNPNVNDVLKFSNISEGLNELSIKQKRQKYIEKIRETTNLAYLNTSFISEFVNKAKELKNESLEVINSFKNSIKEPLSNLSKSYNEYIKNKEKRKILEKEEKAKKIFNDYKKM